MRCQSVACLWWRGAPPLHRVTASVALSQPPTLYTGGSDGSIIWWNLSNNQQEIWPMAILCGHAASIADLEICTPITGHGMIENSNNVDSVPAGSSALISACTDSVLCIWSRSSGHCKRRRKLPSWVGVPSRLSTLPKSRRYVCIACNCVDAAQPTNHAAETVEVGSSGHNQNESIVDKEIHHRRLLKCAVVIVDSCTLNIIQTVFHGSLSIGPLKFMTVIPSLEDMESQLVILADVFGKVQSIEIPESESSGDGGSGFQRNSTYVWSALGMDISHDVVQEVSVATAGNLLVLVFRTLCIFKSTTNGTVIGEISLVDSSLCHGGKFLTGGMFLSTYNSCKTLGVQDTIEGLIENFVVWSNTGAAIIYTISVVGDSFCFEPLCELPPVSDAHGVKIAIYFCHLNNYLLRIESICFDQEASTLWKPHISIFQPPLVQLTQCRAKKSNDCGNPHKCAILGEGGFLGNWIRGFCSVSEAEDLRRDKSLNASKLEDNNFVHDCVANSTNSNGLHRENGNSIMPKWQFVSSSLVLSEDFYAPYAVVYGFCNGEIEIVRFEMLSQNLNNFGGSLHHDTSPSISEQSFLGHNGAVLCLAAHRMMAVSNERSFKRVLVSGGTDCTIRIWDLDTGSLVSVMHHHVGPVRQIILPPPWTDRPWADCFLSVGEDSCVALVSLETLRVERMFPGHPSYPTMVVWDSARGYLACLCQNFSVSSNVVNSLYLWDIKTGARERVLRGTASHSMFDHFCQGINVNAITGNILGGTTSASSLLLSAIEDSSFTQSHVTNKEKGFSTAPAVVNGQRRTKDFHESVGSHVHVNKGKQPIPKSTHAFSSYSDGNFVKQSSSQNLQNKKHVIKCSCPFPGIATMKFDLSSLMHPFQKHEQFVWNGGIQENVHASVQDPEKPNFQQTTSSDCSDVQGSADHPVEEKAWIKSLEGFLLRFSLSFLHLWGVDHELDKLLIDEMMICRPESFVVASGLIGDKGSLTLAFPGLQPTLELWRSSSEFCAMRSLTMVSLAQRMISLSRSSSAASSALAAFYTRHFAEKVPDIRPPLLQLLVSFWQDPSEHVRMAARSLFHCSASRAIPLSLCGPKIIQHAHHMSYINGTGDIVHLNTSDTSASSFIKLNEVAEAKGDYQDDESSMLSWLESFEMQDWISCIGGTSQDAMASHIIVAAALAVWYPSLVKPSLPKLVVHPLMKLVMAMSEKYSSTAAELLAEGMESTWKVCIGPEISRLMGDIFFQIECVSGASANGTMHNPSLAVTIRETLAGILLPSLAMADIVGFLNVIESQIWATASDSPVHLVSIMTLIRVVRGSPKPLAPHLDKVVNFILQTIDLGNSVMRKACLPSSMAALREIVRSFPMVSLNEASTRLAVGDAIGDIHSASIRVYDLQSVTKMKVLDSSGPPGFPSLLGRLSDSMITTAISALTFSPDGEGLVAFSENGLMIRWWSLGSGWWEKLSKSLVPVQCTKLIFVPPEGFSPNSSRSSIMASIVGLDSQVVSQEKTRGLGDADSVKLLIHNLDLSYRLEWVGERKVLLLRHGCELGSFQL